MATLASFVGKLLASVEILLMLRTPSLIRQVGMSIASLILIRPAAALPPGAPPLARGEIVVTETFNDLYRIDPVIGAKTLLDPGTFNPRDIIAIDRTRQILAIDFSNRLVRFDPVALGVTPLTATLFPFTVDIVIEPSGAVLVADADNIFRVDPSTGLTTTLLAGASLNGGFFSMFDVAVGANGRIFVTEFFESLWEVNPTTGSAAPIATLLDLSLVDRINVRSDGDVILRQFATGDLLRINPDTGAVSTFATGLSSGTTDVTIEADDDVVVSAFDGIFRYDADTGIETLLSPDMSFFSPNAIAAAPVPEPATLEIAAIALLGIARLKRRK